MNKIKIIVIAAIAIFTAQTAQPMKFDVTILNESGMDLTLRPGRKKKAVVVIKNGMWKKIKDAGSKAIDYKTTIKRLYGAIDTTPIERKLRESQRDATHLLDLSETSKGTTGALIVIDSNLKHNHMILTNKKLEKFLNDYTVLKKFLPIVSQESKEAQPKLQNLTKQIRNTSFENLFKNEMSPLKKLRDTFRDLIDPLLQLNNRRDDATKAEANLILSSNTFHGNQFFTTYRILNRIYESFIQRLQELYVIVMEKYKSEITNKATEDVSKFTENLAIIPYLYRSFKPAVEAFIKKHSFVAKIENEIKEQAKNLWSRLIIPAQQEIKKVFKNKVEEKINQKLAIIQRQQPSYKMRKKLLNHLIEKELPSIIKSFKEEDHFGKVLPEGLTKEIDRITSNYENEITKEVSVQLVIYSEEDSDSEDEFDDEPVTVGWPWPVEQPEN